MKKGTPHFLYTNKDSPDYVATLRAVLQRQAKGNPFW